MNNLITFYQGRGLEQLWERTDEDLMHSHDCIQWMFPLDTPSEFNPDAPILTPEQIELFHQNPLLRENLMTSFHRFLKVFGVEYVNGEIQGEGNTWFFQTPNHNWLRFTRIIRSLTLLGLPNEAQAFLQFLTVNVPHSDSLVYWREALR